MPLRDRIDAVVFDLFNTLVHFVRRPNFDAWLGEQIDRDPIEVEVAMSAVFEEFETGLPAPERMSLILGLLEVDDHPDIERLLQAEQTDLVNATQLYPGVEPMIEQLPAQGFRLALCSNANPYGIEIARHHGLLELMDESHAFSCEVGVRKPERPMYELAGDIVQASPDRILYVDDGGDRSLWGAKQAGMLTVRVLHVDHEPDDYLEANYEIAAIADLPSLIETAN